MEIASLLARGGREGCLELSEVNGTYQGAFLGNEGIIVEGTITGSPMITVPPSLPIRGIATLREMAVLKCRAEVERRRQRNGAGAWCAARALAPQVR
jgi:hypothetical protein